MWEVQQQLETRFPNCGHVTTTYAYWHTCDWTTNSCLKTENHGQWLALRGVEHAQTYMLSFDNPAPTPPDLLSDEATVEYPPGHSTTERASTYMRQLWRCADRECVERTKRSAHSGNRRPVSSTNCGDSRVSELSWKCAMDKQKWTANGTDREQ